MRYDVDSLCFRYRRLFSAYGTGSKSMRVSHRSSFAASRKLLALLLAAGSIVILNGQRNPTLLERSRAPLAQAAVQFVNPGLVLTIVSAKIASDGTISVDYKITDTGPNGLALDIAGVQTPGVIAPRYVAAYIPKGQEQYVSYVTTTATAVSGGATATQAAADSGGALTPIAPGEYLYTFKTKAPSGFDPTLTNRIGVYGSRNLTPFGLPTNYATALYDFVPAGGTPAPRDVVRDADCNTCHNVLSFHGGSRIGVGLCIMCHTPQSADPNSGNTVDFKVMIHKIHRGLNLPSVAIAKKPYQIYGFNGYTDYSTVVFPANPSSVENSDTRNCAGTCHNPKNGAAQTNVWITKPSRAACGSCHDDINFATGGTNFTGGAIHANLPQIDDNLCTTCHFAQGELPFDISIIGAHLIPDMAPQIPGLNFTLTKVTNGTSGKAPTVTYTVRDNKGNGIPMASFLNGGSLSLTMAGPTTDYGYTNFGSNVTTPGYVTESVAAGSTCTNDGTCTYTFTHTVPAAAKGTYAIGIEGRLPFTFLPGTTAQVTTNYAGTNQVIYFSVDASTVAPRRTVVAQAKCNACHTYLEVHSDLRNNVTYCVFCHNPSNTDAARRPTATNPTDKASPAQGINFALMIHSIHTGDKLAAAGQSFVIVGFGGSHNDFSEVRYPAFLNGTPGDTANCAMCHVNNSEAVLPVGKNPVTDPAGLLSPAAPATTSACTACHFDVPTMAHAVLNTDPKFGESCTVCHSAGAAFDVLVEHAGK
jgi:OmcA/MtrC family decaheme c-type cytochrome